MRLWTTVKRILWALGILGLCVLVGVWAQSRSRNQNRTLRLPNGMVLRVHAVTFGTNHPAQKVAFIDYLPDTARKLVDGRIRIYRSFESMGWTSPSMMLWFFMPKNTYSYCSDATNDFFMEIGDEEGWMVPVQKEGVATDVGGVLMCPIVPWHAKRILVRFMSGIGNELSVMEFDNPVWQKTRPALNADRLPATRSTNGIECILERVVAIAACGSNRPSAMATMRLRGVDVVPDHWSIGYIETSDSYGNRVRCLPTSVRRSGDKYWCTWEPALWPKSAWSLTLYPKRMGKAGLAPEDLINCENIPLPAIDCMTVVTSMVAWGEYRFTAALDRSWECQRGQGSWWSYASRLELRGKNMGAYPPVIDVMEAVDDRGSPVEVADVFIQRDYLGFPCLVFAMPVLSTNAHSISITLGPQRAMPFTFTVMPEIIRTNTNIDNVAGDLL